MLTQETRRRIDKARDILVGQLPLPSDQIELITIALIYKFMGDIDEQSRELGGKPTFFIGALRDLSWQKLISNTLTAEERVTKLIQGIEAISDPKQTHIPDLFKSIFKNAFLKFRDAQVLKLFLDEINGFAYDHSEELGNAFEYLLDTMGTQGQNGQFRTPRNIIEFIVDVVDPQKGDTILDPACGTAGFLISAYKHIMAANTSPKAAEKDPHSGDLLTGGQRDKLTRQVAGYDITPLMCRLSRVNMYLHHFANPVIHEYDTLTNKNRWGDKFDVILANPPFMTPSGGVRTHDKFRIAANRAEVLFADFILEHLDPNGRAGFIVPEGIIFQNNDDYISLRKWLVNEAGLWAVVSLPAQIFQPYSGVKTAAIFVDRALARQREDILLVKVENDGFSLNTNRNPIQANDLPAALQLLTVAKCSTFKSEVPDSKCPLAHLLVPRVDFAKVGSYRAASAAWDFCRKFRTRADRFEKALAEAKAAKDQDEAEKAQKALAKVREEFPLATGLSNLPKTETELRATFDEAIKEPAIAYGINPQQPTKLTADLLKTLDSERDYNLSGERYRKGAVSSTTYKLVPVGGFMKDDVKTVDPRNNPDEMFELWSIPAFDAGRPELLRGGQIGSQKKVVVPGDVLLSRIIPHIRRGWVVRENPDGRRQVASTEWIVFSSSEVVPGFLRQLLVSDFFHVPFMQTITGIGGSLSRANPDAVGEIQVPLPPLDVQRGIVAEIEGYQKVINGARAVLANYRPHVPIHPDWPMEPLGAIADVKLGKMLDQVKHQKGELLPYARNVSVRWGSIDTHDLPEMYFEDDELDRFGLRDGDVLVCEGGEPGRAAVWDGRIPHLKYQKALHRVRFKVPFEPSMLVFLLQEMALSGALVGWLSGTTIKHLTLEAFNRLPIPVPPVATQKALVAEIENEQKLVAANRELITRFEKKIQSTLARIWGEAPPARPPPKPKRTKDSKPQPVAA